VTLSKHQGCIAQNVRSRQSADSPLQQSRGLFRSLRATTNDRKRQSEGFALRTQEVGAISSIAHVTPSSYTPGRGAKPHGRNSTSSFDYVMR
jgi:hypothetical protein